MVKLSSWPFIIWSFSLAGLITYVLVTSSSLPLKVADHFGINGVSNGWSQRSSYVTFSLLLGSGVSFFIVGLLYSIRYLPPSMLNVPKANYWRKPEHYGKACDIMLQHAFVFSSILNLWQAGLHTLILKANAVTPARLDNSWMILMTAILLVASVGWVISLLLLFSRNAGANATSAA